MIDDAPLLPSSTTMNGTVGNSDNKPNSSTPTFSFFVVQCHCGRVRGRFRLDKRVITLWDCTCSDCRMRRNRHFVIPKTDFDLQTTEMSFHHSTTLYEWGTKTAQRRFCKTCGILPWYIPRSNPDGVAITYGCVNFGNNKPLVEIKKYDGVHWEESFAASTIASESQTTTTS